MYPIRFDQHLLLAHVLYVDGTVDDVLWRGAVIVLHLLTLVALNLKVISRIEEDSEQSRENEQTHSLPNDARRGNMRPREEEWGDKNAWTPSGCYKTRRSTRRRGSPDSDPLILPAD